jgi:hypothetical protein
VTIDELNRPDRKPEPWQTGAVGPCVTIESPAGPVELWVLGDQRYRVTAPSGERIVEGFEQAREVAHDLASVRGRAHV